MEALPISMQVRRIAAIKVLRYYHRRKLAQIYHVPVWHKVRSEIIGAAATLVAFVPDYPFTMNPNWGKTMAIVTVMQSTMSLSQCPPQ